MRLTCWGRRKDGWDNKVIVTGTDGTANSLCRVHSPLTSDARVCCSHHVSGSPQQKRLHPHQKQSTEWCCWSKHNQFSPLWTDVTVPDGTRFTPCSSTFPPLVWLNPCYELTYNNSPLIGICWPELGWFQRGHSNKWHVREMCLSVRIDKFWSEKI